MAKNYIVLRTRKIKTMKDIRNLEKHNRREVTQWNANPNVKNDVIKPYNPETIKGEYLEKLGDHKPRKNAVYGIELVMSASSDFFENVSKKDYKSYLDSSVKFLEKNFTKENIVSVDVHLDEKTPHLHALIIPMKDEKLNAKHFIGGSRHRLRNLQQDFYESVKHLNLHRGIESDISKKEHIETMKFYNQEMKIIDNEVSKIIGSKEKLNRKDVEKVIVFHHKKEQENKEIIKETAEIIKEKDTAIEENISLKNKLIKLNNSYTNAIEENTEIRVNFDRELRAEKMKSKSGIEDLKNHFEKRIKNLEIQLSNAKFLHKKNMEIVQKELEKYTFTLANKVVDVWQKISDKYDEFFEELTKPKVRKATRSRTRDEDELEY